MGKRLTNDGTNARHVDPPTLPDVELVPPDPSDSGEGEGEGEDAGEGEGEGEAAS